MLIVARCSILFILCVLPFVIFAQAQEGLEGKWVLERAVVTDLDLKTNKADNTVYLYDTRSNVIGENFFNVSIIKSLTIVNIVDANNVEDIVLDEGSKKNRLLSYFADFIAHIEVDGDKISIRDERLKDETTETLYEYTYELADNKLMLTKESIRFKNELGQRIEQSLKIYLVKQ